MVSNRQTHCPLCQSNEAVPYEKYSEIGSKNKLAKVFECVECKHVYSVVGQSSSDLYQEGKYVLLDTRKSFSDKIKNFDSLRILGQIRKRLPNAKRLLDFGCGKGVFLSALDNSWTADGVETSAERAEFGKAQYGVDISIQFYQGGTIKEGKYDVITSFHVLEHLPDPKALFSELIERNLNDNGMLILEVPLLNSWQSRIAGKNWIQLDPPLHLSHFKTKRLIQFTESLGLKVVRKSTFSLQLGVLGMLQSVMSVFGYKGDLIETLKFKRTFGFMLLLLVALPTAVLLEFLAVCFGRGGVIRVYAVA